jgi:dATP pyrophosphohydrolase
MAAQDVISMCPCFAAEVAADAGVRLSDEHSEYDWVSSERAVKTLIWPGQRRAVQETVEFIVTASAAEPFLRITAV